MFLFNKKPTIAEFDIEGLDVYAIERNRDGDTGISYMRGDEEMEWWCLTTDAQHTNFVQRLTAKIARRAVGEQASGNQIH